MYKSDLTIEVRNLLEAGLYITNLAGSGNADTMWPFQTLQAIFQPQDHSEMTADQQLKSSSDIANQTFGGFF